MKTGATEVGVEKARALRTDWGTEAQARETTDQQGREEWQNKHCLKNPIVKPIVLCKIIKTNEKEAQISTSSLK